MPPDDTIPTAPGSASPKPKPSSISPERFSVCAVRTSNKSITQLPTPPPPSPTTVLSLGEQGCSGTRTKGNEREAHGRNNEVALLKSAVVPKTVNMRLFLTNVTQLGGKRFGSWTSAEESMEIFFETKELEG